MFITTASTTDTIPRALLDSHGGHRTGGRIGPTKKSCSIAKRDLLPKQLTKHGIAKSRVRLTDDAIREIIACYTRESGVRTLERELAAVCRKCAMRFVEENPPKRLTITGSNLEKFLGPRRFLPDEMPQADQVGLVTGLAWTASAARHWKWR